MPFQSQEIQDKVKQANLERFGVDNPFKSKEIQNQIKLTNLEKYGVRYFFQTDLFVEKTKITNLKRYGHECSMQSKEVKEKVKQTNLERYGFENPMQNKEVRKKAKQTNLDKYGVEYSLQSEEVRNKIKETMLERYGVENYQQAHIKNIDNWNDLENFLLANSEKYDCNDLIDYFNITSNTLRSKIKELNLEPHVKDFYTLSVIENIFKESLDEINIPYEVHNRDIISPLEIDFYIPDIKVGIEISPTWTHKYLGEEIYSGNNAIGKSEKDYHYNKFKLSEDKGIELITIFDWTDVDKVINFIKSKYVDKKVDYPVETQVNIVNGISREHNKFLLDNHISGSVKNIKNTEIVELVHDNKLVGLAVFEKKDRYTELIRLAFADGYRIQDSASRMIKTYSKAYPELKSLVAFSDNDLGTGNIYKTLGFDIIEENKGTLIWYNPNKEIKISDLFLEKQGADRSLKNFPGYEQVGIGEDLPGNQEIVQQYGFLPVYDCGYRKWELDLSR